MVYLTYIVSGVVLLGLCIFIHEFGHLLGGKMVGIKAKVFSMGYGKGFLKKKIGDTTYQITLIPFGGYCQFYGEEISSEREGKSYEFLSASPWRRIVVVAMGPLFNLFFGILLFFTMNMIGYSIESNRVMIPKAYQAGKYVSPAFQAGIRTGDYINQINGDKIEGFENIQAKVIFSSGNKLSIKVKRGNKFFDYTVVPKAAGGGRYSIGVMPYGKNIIIGALVPGDVAEKSGLQEMDIVLALDKQKVSTTSEFTSYIKSRAGKKISVNVLRDGQVKNIDITPRLKEFIAVDNVPVFDEETLAIALKNKSIRFNGMTYHSTMEVYDVARRNSGKQFTIVYKKQKITGKIGIDKRGFIGVYPALNPEKKKLTYTFSEAVKESFVKPYNFIVMNLKGFGLLFGGKMNVRENLSGPIRIAKIAGDVAHYQGIAAYILLMAKISIILMIMNFLPIPVVDGGHLVFFLIEGIRGKPVNQKLVEKIQSFFVLLLIGLGIFVVFNDISMLPIFQRFFH